MLQDSVESLQSNRESLEEKLSLLVIGIIIIFIITVTVIKQVRRHLVNA